MPDTDPNMIIDISGNTAELASDYNTSGVGLTGAHVQIMKLGFGDETVTTRVSSSDPFPVILSGQTGDISITGSLNGTGEFEITNLGHHGATSYYLAVAGSTSGALVGMTGTVQGISNGFPVGVSGDVWITNTASIQGVLSGTTAQAEWDSGASGGFGIPVAITGGRRLDSATDSITVSGTVNATGGKNLGAATDAVSVYGWDAGRYVATKLFSDGGTTAGFSGDSLKVALTNTDANVTFNVSATTGVTNDVTTTGGAAGALKVQGITGGEAVLVKGENNGAIEITATTALNTTLSGTVTIDDANIVASLENETKPLITNLKSIDSNTSGIAGIRTDMLGGKIRAKITEMVRPSKIHSGKNPVTNTASVLGSNSQLLSGVNIKCDPENTSNILVGNKDLLKNTTQGYLLEPGETLFIECDNLNKVYTKLSTTGNTGISDQNVYFIGS